MTLSDRIRNAEQVSPDTVRLYRLNVCRAHLRSLQLSARILLGRGVS